MKTLTTISLFIFGVVLTAILTAGLVFYQNNKGNGNQVANSKVGSLAQDKLNGLTASGKSLLLNSAEIAKHNKSGDCWVIISGKVYDITSYFGQHPGGNSTMSPTCGIDATAAYATRDPYAKTSSGSVAHSSNAKNMLADYYVGDFNQTITGTKNTSSTRSGSTNPSVSTVSTPPTVSAPIVNKPQVGQITLSMTEIAKHNKSSDCFMLISDKVYNITSFFGSHPGGNSVMAATCGTDSTDAYMTKDPNATSATGGRNHSSNALSMLTSYYIGNLNQTIGTAVVTQTNTVVAPTTRGDDEWDD